jgi:LysM repeat protein
MRLFKILLILFLLAIIIGGAAGSYYFLVYRPQQRDAQIIARGNVPAAPTPDPSTPDFEKARGFRREHKFAEAREALVAMLDRFPDSSHRREAEEMIGSMNVEQVLNGQPGPGKLEYLVKSGDTMDRVARHLKSNPELIFRANNMESINLKIGQKLEIPQLDTALEIHLAERKVILRNRGQFFKSYPIKTLKVPLKKNFEVKTKVFEKLAYKNGLRVAFGSKEFAGSIRAISFVGHPAYTVFGEPDDPNSGEKAPAGGIGLAEGNAEELQTLVNIGSPVTISTD